MTNADHFFIADYPAHIQAATDAMQTLRAYSNRELETIPEVAQAASVHDLPYTYRAIAATSLIGFMTAQDMNDIVQKDTYYVAGLSARLQDIEKNMHLFCTDTVTGGLNRLGLAMWAKESYRPTDRTYGVLFIDLVGFKKVNDVLGHDIGDKALADAYAYVASLTRVPKISEDVVVEDERRHDTKDVLSVARIGGDEIICVMDFNGLGRLEAEEALLRVKKSLTAKTMVMHSKDGAKTQNYSYRVGVVLTGPHDILPFDEAIKLADMRCNDQRTDADR